MAALVCIAAEGCVCVCVCVFVWKKKGRRCVTAKLLSRSAHTVRQRCLLCAVHFVCLAVTFPIRTQTQINTVQAGRGGECGGGIKRPTVCHVCICLRGVFILCVLRSEPALGLYSLRRSTAASLSARIFIFWFEKQITQFKTTVRDFFFFW